MNPVPKEEAMAAISKAFNRLRHEQREAANQLAALEGDVSENKLVKDVLVQMDGERKCFRSQGGVMLEYKVKSVIPTIDQNLESLEKLIAMKKKDITDKGKEIQAFMAKHNIEVSK